MASRSRSKYANDFTIYDVVEMKFLSAPATSSESERLFSTAKLAVGDLRTRILQENLEKQLFVHHNTLILGFE